MKKTTEKDNSKQFKGQKDDPKSKSISINAKAIVNKTLDNEKGKIFKDEGRKQTNTLSQSFKIEKTRFKSKADLNLYVQVERFFI